MAEWRNNFAAADSPGMPTAEHTISTTRITLPETGVPLERVDAGQIRPEHAHSSLVLMTTMMQAVVGTLAFVSLSGAPSARVLAVLLSIAAVALGTSSMHLGRPAYAWRALKMWRRSWLSREVLLFTLFFASLGATTLCALVPALVNGSSPAIARLSWLTCAVGFVATIASACIYLVPARPAWNMMHTPIDFLLTAALLGSSLSAWLDEAHVFAAVLIAIAWAANHVVRLYRLRTSASFEKRGSYSLQTSDQLLPYSLLALFALVSGVVALAAGYPITAAIITWSASLLARYLFFVSVVPLKMALTFLGGSAA
jgi:DMSO reductase anchor subunit